MFSFVPALLTTGFKVIAWDHCAHGASGGDWGNLEVFKETFLAVAKRRPPIEAAVGHSRGAMMILVALMQRAEVRVGRWCA
jgi:hypothetical protein